MNLMQNWMQIRPLMAPADEGSPAPEPEPVADDAAPEPAAEPAAPDYSFLPEQFRGENGPDLEGFKAHYDELASAQAIRDEALADVPENGAGYEFGIPENLEFGDLELPENFTVDLNTADPVIAPLFGELGEIMHKHGLPKAAANDLMGVMAKYEATKFSQHYAAAKAEMDALGTSGPSRIANIERALQSRLPEAEFSALKAATTTAAGVKALERLIKPRGITTPPAQPSGVDLDNMSPFEKLKLANSKRA